MSRPDFKRVRELLAGAVPSVFPSAQLLVHDAGETVLAEAVGDADGGTMFDLASLTKPLVTVTLAMRLVDDGALTLDEPLRPPAPDDVTAGLALCHASGLPAWRPLFLAAAGAPDPREAKRRVIAAARAEPLEAAPATRVAYSDLGFILLGARLEERTAAPLDETWAAVARAHGFHATYHPDPARCAVTEGDLRGVVHDENARAMGGVAGHAGLFGRATDVAAIARALLDAFHERDRAGDDDGRHARLVRGATLRRFWSPAGTPAGSTWCLGWDRPSPPPAVSAAGTRWPVHGVGHLAFTGCSLWIDPPRDRFVVLLSNRVHPSRANDAIKRFRPVIHDAIVAALDGDA